MKRIAALFCAMAATFAAGSAHAAEVVPYTTTALTQADATQLGRLTRARPPSSWAAPTPFPGFINTATPYLYRTVDVSFAVNAFQTIFYEISVDDPSAVVFASAYNGVYRPTIPNVRYLGDEGSSGNYFPGDPSFFDIVVPRGGTLALVFNSVGQPNLDFSYQVSAFSSTMYDENFLTAAPPVPEPAAWALMLAGFGTIGAMLRRRRIAPAAA